MSGIGNKRAAGEPGPSAPPEKKAGVEDSGTTVETIKLGGVSSTVCLPCIPPLHLSVFFIWRQKCLWGQCEPFCDLACVPCACAQEELDIRTLQTKNRKLAEMLDQRQAIEDELREHIEKLERRQATDDASLLIINRYWNQVGSSFCCFIYAVFLSLLYPYTPFVHIRSLSCLALRVPSFSLMKISASFLNASTWTKVLETFCLKEKHWWCQNLNQTLTVIRSAKRRGNEVRHLSGDSGKDEFQLWTMLMSLSKG